MCTVAAVGVVPTIVRLPPPLSDFSSASGIVCAHVVDYDDVAHSAADMDGDGSLEERMAMPVQNTALLTQGQLQTIIVAEANGADDLNSVLWR